MSHAQVGRTCLSARRTFHSALSRIKLLLVLVLLLFVGRLWQLQIIEGDYYRKLAEHNRIRTIPLLAPRGIIRDREGRPLVVNRPSFYAYLERENIRDLHSTVNFISESLGVKPELVYARLERFKSAPSFQPIVIKEDLSLSDIALIEAHQLEHPEIRISFEPRRYYPYRMVAAHLLGYVGEISEEQLSSREFAGRRPGDIVGKFGVERQYNSILMGRDGQKRVIVNSIGREVSTLARIEPEIGKEIQLTIDLDLQLVAEQLLADKVGAVVALDPRNGEVLVMASRPAFDPNNFAVRISQQEWESLLANPDHPLQNRAIQATFSPGSVFKVIVALAGLEERLLSPSDSTYCTGGTIIYGHFFRCHRGGHGLVDLNGAIVNSCNVFFYYAGKQLGIDRIARYAKAVGLGEKSGIDLPEEKSGLLPTPEWKLSALGQKWYAGETISVAIGQGLVTATPLQLARAIGAIATGKLARPHVLLASPTLSLPPNLVASAHAGELSVSPKALNVPISEQTRQLLLRGMWGVVNAWGTGKAAAVPGVDVCGKTGTAQTISFEGKKRAKDKERFNDNAWFVGFAPKDEPEIVVAVLVERGGFGGQAAAPIAGQILRAYFDKYGQGRRKRSNFNLGEP